MRITRILEKMVVVWFIRKDLPEYISITLPWFRPVIRGIKMCGICGIIANNGRIDEEMLKSMTRILSRRGPDNEGFHVEESSGLGQRSFLSSAHLMKG